MEENKLVSFEIDINLYLKFDYLCRAIGKANDSVIKDLIESYVGFPSRIIANCDETIAKLDKVLLEINDTMRRTTKGKIYSANGLLDGGDEQDEPYPSFWMAAELTGDLPEI